MTAGGHTLKVRVLSLEMRMAKMEKALRKARQEIMEELKGEQGVKGDG